MVWLVTRGDIYTIIHHLYVIYIIECTHSVYMYMYIIYAMFATAEQGHLPWPGVSCVDLFVMFGMGDNLEQSCIQINFFSALPSCGRVPCTWLHTVHGLPSSLAPPKITVSRDTFL